MTPEEAARELAEIAADLRIVLEASRADGLLTLPRGELPRRPIPGPSRGRYAAEGEALESGQQGGQQGGQRGRQQGRQQGRSGPPRAGRGDGRRPPPMRVPEISERQPKAPEPTPAERPRRAPRSAPAARPGAGKWGAYTGRRDPVAELAAIRKASGRRCPVCSNVIIIGEGSTEANLFVVGSAEDKRAEARPFSGPPGDMLDKMLAHVLGLRREQVFVADICPCGFPKNNEAPARGSCGAALHAQINAVRPLVILSMGRPATQALVGGRRGFNALRGRWQRYNGSLPVMPTFHPTWLTENPGDKRLAFEDLKAAAVRYRELEGQ